MSKNVPIQPGPARPQAFRATVALPSFSRRRNYVSIACEGCKKRRGKCSGETPCAACTSRKVECRYEVENDGRRQDVRKRQLEDFERDSELLDDLLQTIQGSKDEQIGQVISLIRSNAPLEDVKRCVRQQIIDIRLSKRQRSPELEHLDNQIERLEHPGPSDAASHGRRSPRRALRIAQLIDQPPFEVRAYPWTMVTTNDGLVSNLISSWLTWEKPFLNLLDEDLFLRDMRHGEIDSKFCSPFLVNALLAFSCPYSDYDEAKSKHGAASELMINFVKEAKQLLEREGADASITKAQGLVCLFIAVSHEGKGGLNYEYLQRAVSICNELEANYEATSRAGPLSDDDREMLRALSVTSWGIFNTETMASFVIRRPARMFPPTIPMPELLKDNHEWRPYPTDGDARSGYCNDLLHHRCELSLIVLDAGVILYGDEREDMPRPELEQAVLKLHQRAVAWRGGLPEYLLINDNAAPSVLTHQGNYLALVLTIFAPLRIQVEDAAPAVVTEAMEQSINAAMEVVELFRKHQSLYGKSHMSGFLVQPLFLALLFFVDHDDIFAYSSEISDLCIYFRAMSRRFPWVLAAFRMFQVSTKQRGKKLPPETEKLFEEFETLDWETRELDRVSSLYPVMGENEPGRSKIQNMGEFLEMMDNLNVDDAGNGDGKD